MSNGSSDAIAPNAQRLLWAGFMAILAAGVGFAIRGGILGDWGAQFGFTGAELGTITGGGLTGFGIVILLGGLLADKLGYGKLVALAFFCHLSSAVLTFFATPAFGSGGEAGKHAAYQCLFWGTFLFAIGNGTLEAVLNPLVATLFPSNRTHYLNILHAGWPAGLVLGGLSNVFLGNTAEHKGLSWEFQLGLFLLPTVLYGVMCLGQRFPKSEASEKGLSIGQMLKDVGMIGGAVIAVLLVLFFQNDLGLSPIVAYVIGAVIVGAIGFATNWSMGAWLLALLLVTHGLVGTVELGTDSWIQNITGNIIDPKSGRWLFVYTSTVMFLLRFVAGPIVHRISPLGLLFISALFGIAGLQLTSRSEGTGMILIALAVYGMGKTFFWPTMLAVVGDRFPRSGAIAISCMGGMGMLAAGLIGGPGIGYFKDRYAGQELLAADPKVHATYVAAKASPFPLPLLDAAKGLDGVKLGEVKNTPVEKQTEDQKKVAAADLKGDRLTLQTVSLVPATMAAIYLLLFLYFKASGGYKVVHIGEVEASK